METVKFVNLADLIDPSDEGGRSYKEINMDKHHTLAVGELVECESGIRMFIAKQTRDCDGTPLYSLTPTKGDYIQERKGFGNDKWINGYPEDALTLIPRKL